METDQRFSHYTALLLRYLFFIILSLFSLYIFGQFSGFENRYISLLLKLSFYSSAFYISSGLIYLLVLLYDAFNLKHLLLGRLIFHLLSMVIIFIIGYVSAVISIF
ncbi:MAG: hypothetical protein K9L21_03520 [Spirochaetia bacterium]|nr:hypothetical protein [Spirochaetia bacterium]